MASTPLRVSLSVTLDGSGEATGIIGPNSPYDTWVVEQVSLRGTSSVQPTVRIYRDVVGDESFLAATFVGNEDTAGGSPPWTLPPGSRLAFVWTLGTAGARQSARLEGTVNTP